jgi:hypothetical protein
VLVTGGHGSRHERAARDLAPLRPRRLAPHLHVSTRPALAATAGMTTAERFI